MSKTFGEHLKLLMEQRNLSAAKLGKVIGCNPKTILEWTDKGGRMPRDPKHIKALAEYFNVSVHALLYGEEDPRSSINSILEKSEIHTGTYELTIKRVNVKGGK